ncbi:MAG: hypothetical protein GXY76_03495 [Chloroflexi bacterium]|nr:hypothetical protein [Chloroflexota bacterium]
MAAVSIIATVALALGLLSWGMDVNQAVVNESNVSYSKAAMQQVQERRSQVEQELAEARRRGDAVTVAELQALRDGLNAIERRWNPAAQLRQAEQTRAAFIEEGQKKAAIDMGAGLVSRGVGGFGKVQGTFMRGTNWPPAKSILTWDPKAAQAVRLILEADRPVLQVIELADDAEDHLSVVLAGFDVLRGTMGSGGQPQDAQAAYEGVSGALQGLEGLRALPSTVGEYLKGSLERQARAANPQIAGLPEEEQEAFVRDQACNRLRGLQASESDPDRANAVRVAQAMLDCPQLVSQAAPSATASGTSTKRAANVAAAASTPTSAATPTLRPARTATRAATLAPTRAPTRTPTPTIATALVWVRDSQSVINAADAPLAIHEGGGVTREWVFTGPDREARAASATATAQASARVDGKFTSYQVGETLFIWNERYVDRGSEHHNLTVEARFDAPPQTLKLGQKATLAVRFAHSGAIASSYYYGMSFQYGADTAHRHLVEPNQPLTYAPWSGIAGPATKSWTLTAPQGAKAGDTFQVWAKGAGHPPCDVTWTYRAGYR